MSPNVEGSTIAQPEGENGVVEVGPDFERDQEKRRRLHEMIVAHYNPMGPHSIKSRLQTFRAQ